MLGATVLFVVLAVRGNLRPTPFVPTLILGLLQTTGFSLFAVLAEARRPRAGLPVLAHLVVEPEVPVQLLSRQSFLAAMARSTT